ncbi:MAG: hypothetical protein ABSC41_01690 [Acidimicrobiales bacterium]
MRRRYREAHWYYRGGVPPAPGRTRRRWRRFVAHCRQSVGHARLAVVEVVAERRRSVAIAAAVAALVALTYFGGQLIGGVRSPIVHHEAVAPHAISSPVSLKPETIALREVEHASLPDTAKRSSVSHRAKGSPARPASKSRTAAAAPGSSGTPAPPKTAIATAVAAALSEPSPTSTDVGPSSAVTTVDPPSDPPTTTDPPPVTTTTVAAPPTSTTTEPPTTTTTVVPPTTTLPGP